MTNRHTNAQLPFRTTGVARSWRTAAAFLLVAAVASAQTPSPKQPDEAAFMEAVVTAFSVVLDNDVLPHLGSPNEDRNYTGGVGFRLSGRIVKAAGASKPLEFLDWLTRMNRLHEKGERRYHSALLFGTAFTPDLLQYPQPLTDDRPYGSVVGLSVRRMSVDGATLNRAWSSDLVVARLGSAYPGEVQGRLHAWLRNRSGRPTPYAPAGWHNQISAGGEFTGLYRAGYEQRLAGADSGGNRKHWQMVGGGEGSVGYYTNAAVSLSSRVGFFTSDFWEYSSGGMNLGVGQQKSGDSGAPRWDLFAFGLLRSRLVGYNALLEGQFKNSVHTVRPRRLIGEWEGGVAASVPLRSYQLQAVYQFAQGRSIEFHGPHPRSHAWGSLVITVSKPGGKP